MTLLYLDTSALARLYTREEGHEHVSAEYARSTGVVCHDNTFVAPHQLLMDNFVWRKVVWEVLPLTPCAANPQSGIEDFTYRVDALVSVFWSEQKVRQDEEVSFVVQVALVGFSL